MDLIAVMLICIAFGYFGGKEKGFHKLNEFLGLRD